ncbi:MAG: hypothetical protein Q8914_09635 [Bacteroidota bacterium]|nr:hypothetical protein [Bacteroidota bacterium]
MENSYFVYTTNGDTFEIERFHTCIWEFDNNSSLVEFGFEISMEQSHHLDDIEFCLYIPWLTEKAKFQDLYEKLKDPENSRFIFNDSILNTSNIDEGRGLLGVSHEFRSRNLLTILPVTTEYEPKIAHIKIDLRHYNQFQGNKGNVYVRFSIIPECGFISTRKNGIAKSTVIYDIKINERRNIPDELVGDLNNANMCKIKDCFSFNILPNSYDIIFYDNSALRNVRLLEYDAFTKYIKDERVKKDDLMVVFNKKSNPESFSFFSIYTKERIGMAQFLLAIFFNMLCGFLFFIASARISAEHELSYTELYKKSPVEITAAVAVIFLIFIIFCWPPIKKFLFKENR